MAKPANTEDASLTRSDGFAGRCRSIGSPGALSGRRAIHAEFHFLSLSPVLGFPMFPPCGSAANVNRSASTVVSFPKAEPVRGALAELWLLKPGSFAPPANAYEIRREAAFRRLLEACRGAYPNSGERGLDRYHEPCGDRPLRMIRTAGIVGHLHMAARGS